MKQDAAAPAVISGQSPRVSVITPVWNAAGTLADTVASAQAQTVTDWEMLVIDDGSQDASRAIARNLAAQDARIRLLGWSENRGAAAARNAGIRAARGRFIAFLDADDLWRPEKLARQVAVMEDGHSPFVFSAYARVDVGGRVQDVVMPPPRVTYPQLLRSNVIGCLTAIYDTAYFGKVEMPLLRRRQDFALWLTLLKRVSHACALSEVLADYRVRPDSLSANKLVAARETWALYRQVEALSWPRASYYFLSYAGRGVSGRLRSR